jgi:hypothetical protein
MYKWIVLKTILKFTLKFTLKQLQHVLVQSHHHQGAHYSCLLKLQLWKCEKKKVKSVSICLLSNVAKHVHCYFLPQTTSHVHNSFSTNYLLHLTCNDLPFRQVILDAYKGTVQCNSNHTAIILYSVWETYRLCIFNSMFLLSKVPCCMHQHLQCKCKKEW